MPGIHKTSAILAVLGALSLATSPAHSADLASTLGGDCCADLESRVAGLEATTVRKGNKKVSLTVSGRVHANIMFWNDHAAALDPGAVFDQSSDVYFGNVADNETQIVLNGSGRISGDLSAGFLMTLRDDFGGADSQTSHQTGNVLTNYTTYVFLKSAKWGEYRLGNLPSASDDAYYVDYGAAATIGGLYRSVLVSNFFLRANGINAGKLTDVTYGHVLGELPDQNQDRLMYISPVWNGFTYKSDMGTDTGSVALTWTGTSGSLHGAFGAGYERSTKVPGQSPGGDQSVQLASAATVPLTGLTHDLLRQFAVSASLLEDKSGLFVSGEYSRAYASIPGRQDATNWYARAGWTKNVTGMGVTTIGAQYQRTDNKLANDTSAHLWGIGIDQAIDSVASNIYVHYQHDSFDTSGVVGNAASSTLPGVECADGAQSVCAIDAQAIDSVTTGIVINF